MRADSDLVPGRRRRLAKVVGCVVLFALCGCASQPRSTSPFPIKSSGSPFASKGSPWTILCMELRGPERREQSEQIAETLRRTPGIRPGDVVLLDDPDGVSRLYYGVYYRRTDPETGKRSIPERLRRDMELVKQLGTPQGKYYFLTARTVRVPTPDVGDPDWVLSKVNAVYSLQVAVFEPTDEFWEFKLAAAEYCKLLRDKGYEAYYHHGAGCSVVTVGAFGEGAVRRDAEGRAFYSPEVTMLQRDELLRYNRLNGSIYSIKTAEGHSERVKSRLVRIPSDEEFDPWEVKQPY